MKHRPQKLKHSINVVLTYLVIASLVLAIVLDAVRAEWFNLFIASVALLLISFTLIFPRKLRFSLPSEMEVLIVLFIYAGSFLGGPRQFYYRFPWWDSFLHLISGMALAMAGFLILYSVIKDEELKARPFLFAFFTFCFAVTFGVLWEVFEFSMDQIFGTNMQRWQGTGVVDTMKDLIMDSVGALIISVYVYVFLKRGNRSVVIRLVDRFYQKNPHLVNEEDRIYRQTHHSDT